jgi:hypothetical protein
VIPAGPRRTPSLAGTGSSQWSWTGADRRSAWSHVMLDEMPRRILDQRKSFLSTGALRELVDREFEVLIGVVAPWLTWSPDI